jgi:hypothetical protein
MMDAIFILVYPNYCKAAIGLQGMQGWRFICPHPQSIDQKVKKSFQAF